MASDTIVLRCVHVKNDGHGRNHKGISNSPEYISWQHMVHRCTNPKSHAYARSALSNFSQQLTENHMSDKAALDTAVAAFETADATYVAAHRADAGAQAEIAATQTAITAAQQQAQATVDQLNAQLTNQQASQQNTATLLQTAVDDRKAKHDALTAIVAVDATPTDP